MRETASVVPPTRDRAHSLPRAIGSQLARLEPGDGWIARGRRLDRRRGFVGRELRPAGSVPAASASSRRGREKRRSAGGARTARDMPRFARSLAAGEAPCRGPHAPRARSTRAASGTSGRRRSTASSATAGSRAGSAVPSASRTRHPRCPWPGCCRTVLGTRRSGSASATSRRRHRPDRSSTSVRCASARNGWGRSSAARRTCRPSKSSRRWHGSCGRDRPLSSTARRSSSPIIRARDRPAPIT